jgi:mRNA interferase MazF
VTSNPYGDAQAIPLNAADCAVGGLKVASYARPGKLFTANRTLFTGSAGRLNDAALQRILTAVVALLRPGSNP